jgi:hypothetical protein
MVRCDSHFILSIPLLLQGLTLTHLVQITLASRLAWRIELCSAWVIKGVRLAAATSIQPGTRPMQQGDHSLTCTCGHRVILIDHLNLGR